MPKNSRRAVPKSAAAKGKRKNRSGRRPATLSSKQMEAPSKEVEEFQPRPILRVPKIESLTNPYIMSDLKKIGIIATAMFAILIILYFVL